MTDFLLLVLLLATVVVAAYFYLKRRQQHTHVTETGGSVEHRHEQGPTDRIADHGHDLDTPAADVDSPTATRER